MYCPKIGPMLKHTCDELNTLIQSMDDKDFKDAWAAAKGDAAKMPHYSFAVEVDKNIPDKKA